jgi:hypothetical protein
MITPVIHWLKALASSGYGTDVAQDQANNYDGKLFNQSVDGLPLPEWITDTPTGVGLRFLGTVGSSSTIDHQWVNGITPVTYSSSWGLGARFRSRANSIKGGGIADLVNNSLVFDGRCGNVTTQLYMRGDGKVAARLQTTAWSSGADYKYITSSKSLNDGQWHSVAIGYCSGSGFSLYVDNIVDGTLALSQYAFTEGLRLRASPPCLDNLIGAYADYVTFDGDLCDIRYFADDCLDGDEYLPQIANAIMFSCNT